VLLACFSDGGSGEISRRSNIPQGLDLQCKKTKNVKAKLTVDNAGGASPFPSRSLWVVSASLPWLQPSLACVEWDGGSCRACGYPLPSLAYRFLDCSASGSLRCAIFGTASIFGLWSRPWGVARLLGLRVVPPRPYLSEGVG